MAGAYLDAIEFDEERIRDANKSAKNSAQGLKEMPSQASQMAIQRALLDWSTHLTSQTLLITDSPKQENGFLRCSAACALYLSQPAFTPHRIVLRWFCDNFKILNVHHMTLDLYGQLLSQAPPKSNDGRSRFVHPVALDELMGLLKAQILEQLERSPVYCLVDSVNAYEAQDAKKGDICRLLKMLSAVVGTSTTCSFKLLITTCKSGCAEGTVQSTKCVVVRDDGA